MQELLVLKKITQPGYLLLMFEYTVYLIKDNE